MDSETTAALIGATVGGGGSLVAQVVGAWFSRGAERRRYEWEHSQRFIDLKRELFARYLAAHSTFANYLFRPSSAPGGRTDLVDTYIQHVEDAESIKQEMLLIAPEMTDPCERLDSLRSLAFEVELHADNPAWVAKFLEGHHGDPPLMAYRGGIAICGDEMTSNLGTG